MPISKKRETLHLKNKSNISYFFWMLVDKEQNQKILFSVRISSEFKYLSTSGVKSSTKPEWQWLSLKSLYCLLIIYESISLDSSL